MRDLLDDIATNLNLTYLSDLRTLECQKKDILHALEQIPARTYELEAWIEAVHYITGNNNTMPTSEKQARELIVQAVS